MTITFEKETDAETGDICVYKVLKDDKYVNEQYVFPTGTTDASIISQIETDLIAKGYT